MVWFGFKTKKRNRTEPHPLLVIFPINHISFVLLKALLEFLHSIYSHRRNAQTMFNDIESTSTTLSLGVTLTRLKWLML